MFREWMGDERIILNDSSCKYCTNNDIRQAMSSHVGQILGIGDDDKLFYQCESHFSYLYVKINYCPMCGRKLGGK